MTPDYAHLDALTVELERRGLKCEPRFADFPPSLLVRHPALPTIGETVRVDARPTGAGTSSLWFRSSSNTWLAPSGAPSHAAESIANQLDRYAHGHMTVTPAAKPQAPTPPDGSDQIQAANRLEADLPGVKAWYGKATRAWWALVPLKSGPRLLSAPDTRQLREEIINATRRP